MSPMAAVFCLLLALVGVIWASPPVKLEHTIKVASNQPSQHHTFLKTDTTLRLQELRQTMQQHGLAAYIVTTSDQHQSEYVADYDKRREYITGFTGSNGDAVVTLSAAALWTDSRYFLQAEEQLDSNWQLVKQGVEGEPNITEWLKSSLKPGDKISADPRMISYIEWTTWEKALGELQLIPTEENLIDAIWTTDRPAYPDQQLIIHDVKYAGSTWQEKIQMVRDKLTTNAMVVTGLDEIAWLLNLRGGDIPFTPVFRSYMIIGPTYNTLYLPANLQTAQISHYLSSQGGSSESVGIKEYNEIWNDLKLLGVSGINTLLPGQFGYSKGVSYQIVNMLNSSNKIFEASPILILKAQKNAVEMDGFRTAHIRDAVALLQMMEVLEKEVPAGKVWTEIGVSIELERLRKLQVNNQGPSFETIAAYGPHSASPHYSPTNETSTEIGTDSMLTIDSGGQYFEGTTDVTRTMHYGIPTEEQKVIYTNVLKGCIDIAQIIFPEGKTMYELEILIRAPLYSLGLDYGHGSTHGVGYFLGVHESFSITFQENFVGSQEPGYYRDNEFGMRLENLVAVVQANTTYTSNRQFLTFEPLTLVPYESNLIKSDMLSSQELKWLNNYHSIIANVVGEELLRQGLNSTYAWLLEKTKPIV